MAILGYDPFEIARLAQMQAQGFAQSAGRAGQMWGQGLAALGQGVGRGLEKRADRQHETGLLDIAQKREAEKQLRDQQNTLLDLAGQNLYYGGPQRAAAFNTIAAEHPEQAAAFRDLNAAEYNQGATGAIDLATLAAQNPMLAAGYLKAKNEDAKQHVTAEASGHFPKMVGDAKGEVDKAASVVQKSSQNLQALSAARETAANLLRAVEAGTDTSAQQYATAAALAQAIGAGAMNEGDVANLSGLNSSISYQLINSSIQAGSLPVMLSWIIGGDENQIRDYAAKQGIELPPPGKLFTKAAATGTAQELLRITSAKIKSEVETLDDYNANVYGPYAQFWMGGGWQDKTGYIVPVDYVRGVADRYRQGRPASANIGDFR